MLPRTALKEFMLANPLYKGALVTAFTVDEDGEATTIKATLWDGPEIDANALSNPQQLSSEGRFLQPVYFEVPVILTITGLTVADHSTGIVYPVNRAIVRNTVEYTDDFLGDTLRAEWSSATGSDGQVVAPAIEVGQVGGIVKMTTGDDAAGDMATNGVLLVLGQNFKAENGGLAIEWRVKLSSIADVCVFVGLTDTIALEAPFTLAAAVLTSNAADAVGALYDTSATVPNWKLVGVDTNVNATVQDADVAPVAGEFDYWRIEITNEGDAYFFRNGAAVGEVMEDAMAPDVVLTPALVAFSRAAASVVVRADVMHIEFTRE